MNTASRAALAVLGAGAAGAAWAFGVEPRFFAIRCAELAVLPPGAAPIRVLHLADLHLLPRQRMKRDWVSRLEALEPDLVVNTGDNLAAFDAVPAVLEAYAGLLERPGVFVFGSNDYYAPKARNPLRYFKGPSRAPRAADLAQRALPIEDLRSAFTSAGWADLNNAAASREIGGTSISFSGVDDPHIGRANLESIRFTPGAGLNFGVAHAPYGRVLDAFAVAGADLTLAGHTHGGQIRIPFWGAPVTNCDLRHDQARGVIDWRGMPVNVSAGLGYSPYAPLRFSCRPEVSLLTLLPREV